MRNLILAVSAIGVLGVATPFSAPAQAEERKVIIREGHRDHPRFWDRDHHHDHKTVIIKKDRY
jgi:Ni/Co efflux regulator RcnB